MFLIFDVKKKNRGLTIILRHSISQTKILLEGYVCYTWFLIVWQPQGPQDHPYKALLHLPGTHNCEA